MPEDDRKIATRLHSIVKRSAHSLSPRTWYGMPAYELEGKVVCFFQPAAKFKTRYATIGFTDRAALDNGSMWSVAYAIKALGDREEETITGLLKKALS